jgi:hypothetical protein
MGVSRFSMLTPRGEPKKCWGQRENHCSARWRFLSPILSFFWNLTICRSGTPSAMKFGKQKADNRDVLTCRGIIGAPETGRQAIV